MFDSKVLNLSSSPSTSPYTLILAISLVSIPLTTSIIERGLMWNPSTSEFKAARTIIGLAFKFAVTIFLSVTVL